jgi:hypothetical protein
VKLGVAEKLLIAAYQLELSGVRPFSAEDLVVAAWERYPDTFGLAGHIDETGRALYPDSNRVFAEIMGAKPIRKRGFLEKVGNKTYQVTSTGQARVAELMAGPETPSLKAALSRKHKEELRNLLNSRAFAKWKQQRPDEITFMDACGFWGITPRSSAIELESHLGHVDDLLRRAVGAFASGDVALEHAGDVIAPESISSLRKLHDEIQNAFAQDLAVIRRRTDERT